MHMKTRQVLTVNQVFEIIGSFCECKDWQKAFTAVMPKRKGAEEKILTDIKKPKLEEKESNGNLVGNDENKNEESVQKQLSV